MLSLALVALLAFVACDLNEPSVEEKLQLSVDKKEIVADGKDAATFIVKDWEGSILEDATIYFADSHEALDNQVFNTKYAGEYSFYAKRGSVKSDIINIIAKEDKPEPDTEPQEKELKLSVETATIYVNETATFTVEYNGNDVTSEATIYLADGDVELEDNTYTATAEGFYTFYAKYEDVISDSVTVNVRMKIVEEQKPIEIEASALTIKANGVDYTKFTVMQDGANITDLSTIYINGGVLNGNRFVTTTPGKYIVYAVKDEQKSNEVTISAEEVASTGKSIVFADGVTLTSGWYDVNKVGAGDNGDINMCWAASASNIIQWWQDRYMEQGGTLPSTAITGPGKDHYELALMDIYHSEWDNSLGGHVEQAIPWYFEGKLNGGEYASAGTQAVPKSNGGYWLGVWDRIVSNMYCGYDYFSYETFNTAYTYTVCYNNYYLWGNGSSLEGTDRLKYYTDLVVRAFDYGMASMTISLSSNISSLHHAVTLWGYEIDNSTGLLTRVWVTDSDDLTTEPKGQILHEYTVSIGEGKSHIQLTCPSVRYGSVWVVNIVPVAGPNSK